ncbi:MAG: amino acid ABC transporter ATP-binding protein [Opitutales bacterium]
MDLELRQLSKCFGDHVVLDRLDLNLAGAHCVALIGPSGGGKTTLLRLIAGLEYPSGGQIVLNGEPIDYRDQPLLAHRRRVGTVFQAFNLFPHLSAMDNVMLPLTRVHRLAEAEARERAEGLLARFGLEDHRHKKPAALSGGQRQRVAIVRALAVEPRVLLFDEPTSALDPEMTAEVLDAIAELRSQGRDLLLVTHEMGFARHLADEVLFLADARVVEHGPPEVVFEDAATPEVQRFLARVLRY